VKLDTSIQFEEKYDSASVVVAPGGWCSCCCCWCHCHCHAAAITEHDDEEL
jgi:streptolysin S family bacteriocin protoxin